MNKIQFSVFVLLVIIAYLILDTYDQKSMNDDIALKHAIEKAELITVRADGKGSGPSSFTDETNDTESFILVTFWASWCIPCLKEADALNELDESLQNKIKIWGVASMDEINQVKKSEFIRKTSFDIYFDQNDQLADFYNVNNLPQSFLFDQTGRFYQHFKQAIESHDVEILNKLLH